MTKNRKHIIAILCILAFSAIMIVYSIGKYNPFPIPSSTVCENVTDEYQGENLNIVIDKSGARVLFLDKESNLIAANSTSLLDNPMPFYTACACDSDYYYVFSYSVNVTEEYICKQSLDKYNSKGEYVGTLLSQDYDISNQEDVNSAQDMTMDDKYLYVTTISSDYKKCNVIKIDKNQSSLHKNGADKPLDLWNASYEYKNISTDNDGLINNFCRYKPQTDQFATISSSGYKYLFSENLSKIQKSRIDGEITIDTQISDIENNEIIIQNGSDWEQKQINYSWELILRLVLFWLGILFLLVILLILIINIAKKLIIAKTKINFRAITTVISVIVISVIVVGFYSSEINKNAEDNIASTLAGLSSVSSVTHNDKIVNCIEQFQASNTINSDTYNYIHNLLSVSTNAAVNNGCNAMFALMSYKDDNLELIVDSSSDIMHSQIPNLEYVYYISENTEICQHNNSWGSYLDAVTWITNDKNERIGGLVAIAQYSVFDSSTIQDCVWIFISLLALIISVSFIATELNSFYKLHNLKRRLMHKNFKHPEAVLARPMQFFSVLTNSCDSALITLIAKDMLQGWDTDYIMLLIGLPLSIKALGFFIGVPLQVKLFSKFKTKNVLVWCSALTIVCFIGCFFSIRLNCFWTLLALIFIGSMLNEVMFLFSTALPMAIEDKGLQARTTRELSAGKISAISITTLAAGFVVGQFGNEYIYAVAIVAALSTLVYVMLSFNKNLDLHDLFGSKQNKSGTWTQMKNFVTKPPIIVIVFFVTVLTTIATGYQNFLFPLIADSANVSKMLISNIIVFVNAIIFFTVPLISKIERKTSFTALITVCCLVIGCAFLSMIINDTIVWSIVVLFVIVMFVKILEPTSMNYWHNYVEVNKLDKMAGQKTVFYVSSATESARGPLLGALVNISYNFCMLIVGGFALLAGLLAYLVCNRRERRK